MNETKFIKGYIVGNATEPLPDITCAGPFVDARDCPIHRKDVFGPQDAFGSEEFYQMMEDYRHDRISFEKIKAYIRREIEIARRSPK